MQSPFTGQSSVEKKTKKKQCMAKYDEMKNNQN